MELATLFEEARKHRGLSYRQVSNEIGLSHTTLIQLKENKPFQFDTAVAVCRWLGVSVTAAAGLDENDQMIAMIATVLKTAPELKKAFSLIAKDVEAGNLILTDLEEVMDFAAFVIHKRHSSRK